MTSPDSQKTKGISTTLIVALITAAGLVLAAALPPLIQYYFPTQPSLPKAVPEEPPKPAPAQPNSVGSERGTNAFIGPNLICWGRIPVLPVGSRKHTREFAFTFPERFKTPPTVTHGINVTGTGYSFAVYNAEVTETGYTGFLVEVNSRPTDVAVAMNYTAIGTPAIPPR